MPEGIQQFQSWFGDVLPGRVREPGREEGSEAQLGLWKRAGMEEFVLFMLSPQLLSLQTLFLNKPSTRMEIGLESTTRLARGFELSKGIPPQWPVWWFPCTLLTHQRKLWKTHKNYYVSMAISRSSLTGRS